MLFREIFIKKLHQLPDEEAFEIKTVEDAINYVQQRCGGLE